MSLRCIVEFSLYLDNFRNIDLFHQGLYKTRVSINRNENISYPYNMITKNIPSSSADPHEISPGHLEEQFAETKSFLVRYFDESVRIEEIIYFRSEIEIAKNMNETDFKLTVDLLFTDLNGQVAVEQALEAAKQPLQYEKVSSASFTLKFPSTFQSVYLPIVFDNNHCCIINSVVHYLILDYKFRPFFLGRPVDISEGLALSIFCSNHKSGREYIGSSQTDSTYNKFMTPLSKTYSRLREYYLSILSKCLTEAQRHTLQLYYVPPILSLPGNPIQMLIPNNKFYMESISTAPLNDSDDSISEEKPGSSHRFSQRVASHDAKKIAATMMAELNMVSGQIFQL